MKPRRHLRPCIPPALPFPPPNPFEAAPATPAHGPPLPDAPLLGRVLLQELLTRFAAAYSEAKARESALDFEDLQLHARNLLRDNEAIREREGLRFRSIMVDEFQDTDPAQCALDDLPLPPAPRPS